MAKLQLLSDYLTERLMGAVREILEVVGGTVLEYEEESVRAHQEIELLRRRLRDAGVEAPGWPEVSQPVVNLEPGSASPAEPELGGQDLSLQRDLLPGEEKSTARRRQDSCSPPKPPSPGGDTAPLQCLPFTSTCLKSDREEDSELSDLFKVRILSPTEELAEPGVDSDLIKSEADIPSFSGSQQPVDPPCPSDTSPGVATGEPETPELRGKRPHCCPQCGKTFCHMSRLKIHLRIHTGEKPYSCAQCGKCFNNDGTLKNHQRVHTEVRLYSCTQCGMRFKDAYTCKKHQKVHVAQRLYRCSFCTLQFNDAAGLQSHQKTHMAERPYCCMFCGKEFMILGKLNKHLKSHTKEIAYS